MVLSVPEPIFIKHTTGQEWTLQQRQHSLQSADRDVHMQAFAICLIELFQPLRESRSDSAL